MSLPSYESNKINIHNSDKTNVHSCDKMNIHSGDKMNVHSGVEINVFSGCGDKMSIHSGDKILPLNFLSSLSPRRSILLSPPASKFGHMGTLCDPDAKKIVKLGSRSRSNN